MNAIKKRKKGKFMTVLLWILTLVLLIILYFSIPYSPLKSSFQREVSRLIQAQDEETNLFTQEDIHDLPVPVKRYFSTCGYLGKPKMEYMKIAYKNAVFLLSKDQPYTKIDYTQYNFVKEPERMALIDTRMYGIPFQGVDSYAAGNGAMKGVIGKTITLFNEIGVEMNTSCLVNVLSECLMIPNVALQDYITWESMDDTHAKGIISYYGITASGTFTFSEAGELLSFTTDDRWAIETNGQKMQVPWSVVLSDYEETDGIRKPTRFKAVWHYEGGDSVYFESDDAVITHYSEQNSAYN